MKLLIYWSKIKSGETECFNNHLKISTIRKLEDINDTKIVDMRYTFRPNKNRASKFAFMNILLPIRTPSLQHHKPHAIQSFSSINVWKMSLTYIYIVSATFPFKIFCRSFEFWCVLRWTRRLEIRKNLRNWCWIFLRQCFGVFNLFFLSQDSPRLVFCTKCTSLSFDPCLWFDLLCPVSIMACNCDSRPPRLRNFNYVFKINLSLLVFKSFSLLINIFKTGVLRRSRSSYSNGSENGKFQLSPNDENSFRVTMYLDISLALHPHYHYDSRSWYHKWKANSFPLQQVSESDQLLGFLRAFLLSLFYRKIEIVQASFRLKLQFVF